MKRIGTIVVLAITSLCVAPQVGHAARSCSTLASGGPGGNSYYIGIDTTSPGIGVCYQLDPSGPGQSTGRLFLDADADSDGNVDLVVAGCANGNYACYPDVEYGVRLRPEPCGAHGAECSQIYLTAWDTGTHQLEIPVSAFGGEIHSPTPETDHGRVCAGVCFGGVKWDVGAVHVNGVTVNVCFIVSDETDCANAIES